MNRTTDLSDNTQHNLCCANPADFTGMDFREIILSSPVAIVICTDEKIVFLNNAALKLFRAETTSDLEGKDIWDFIPEKNHHSFKNAINNIVNDKKAYISRETVIISTDGRMTDVEISSSGFNFNGMQGIQVFITEISEKKQSIRNVQLEEKYYKIIFEATGTAMLFIEEDGIISLVNSECEKISGFTKEEIEGKKNWTEFIAPDDTELLEKKREYRLDNIDIPMTFEFRIIDKERKIHNAFITITTVPGTRKSLASIIDLTEIKRAQKILASTQQNYRLFVENTNEAIAIIQDELVCYVNSKLCRLTGTSEERILNRKFYTLVPPDFCNIVRNEYWGRLNGLKSKFLSPVKIINQAGNEKWFQINSVLTIWGEEPAVLFFFNDVTETKKIQDALMASEERYRLLAENAKDIIIVYDETGNISYINSSGCKTFGIKKNSGLKINISDILFPGSEYITHAALINENTRDVKNYNRLVDVLNTSGELIQLETISSPIKIDNERYGMLVIARDITERKKLEKEIIFISERIRQQVSRDLHDDLNPHLIGVEALTHVLYVTLKKKHIDESSDVKKIAELINKAIKKIYRLARGLCPIDLESTGIQTPLMKMIKLIRNFYGIECKFIYDDTVKIKDITLATNLYYIAQEAAFNSAKYSGGSLIIITLKRNSESLILSIEDNGIGIPNIPEPDPEKSNGMGLKIMKYRAEIIDGVFSIQDNIPSGTIISIKIPINILKSEGRITYGGRIPKTKPETENIFS